MWRRHGDEGGGGVRAPLLPRPRSAHNALEAQVVYMTSARVFGLSNASLAGPIMAQWYLDNEAKIVAAATKARGPYVMSVNTSYGLRRVKLAYPPE
jgi:hypothetical protein